jgi:hypothetical protein
VSDSRITVLRQELQLASDLCSSECTESQSSIDGPGSRVGCSQEVGACEMVVVVAGCGARAEDATGATS